MQIFVRFIGTEKVFSIQTKPGETIQTLKTKINDKISCTCEHRLMYENQILEEQGQSTLEEYGIKQESTLQVVSLLRTNKPYYGEAIPQEGLLFHLEKRNIPIFHLSCQSCPISEWKSNDLVGMIVYDTFEDRDLKLKIKPGYVFIQTMKKIQEMEIEIDTEKEKEKEKEKDKEKDKDKNNQMYEKLFKSLFQKEPSTLQIWTKDFVKRKKFAWNFVSPLSSSLFLSSASTSPSPGSQEGKKRWRQSEMSLVRLALKYWEDGGEQNFDVINAIRRKGERCPDCKTTNCAWPVEFFLHD